LPDSEIDTGAVVSGLDIAVRFFRTTDGNAVIIPCIYHGTAADDVQHVGPGIQIDGIAAGNHGDQTGGWMVSSPESVRWSPVPCSDTKVDVMEFATVADLRRLGFTRIVISCEVHQVSKATAHETYPVVAAGSPAQQRAAASALGLAYGPRFMASRFQNQNVKKQANLLKTCVN
jgi:hypothetical protein